MSGYKTYGLAILGIVFAVSGVVTGHLQGKEAMEIIYAALLAAGIRHGVTTGA